MYYNTPSPQKSRKIATKTCNKNVKNEARKTAPRRNFYFLNDCVLPPPHCILYTNRRLVVKRFQATIYIIFYMRNDLIKQRLVEELNSCRLTTTEIAKRVGVSPEMITQYRTTKKLPKLDTFAKLCKELDLDAAYILGLTKD